MSERIQIEPEYVYVTIPAEYICVYHRILAMLADYGEEMLKDCKASCKDRNSNVIDCFNMFNAAVASRKLGKTKLAETLIKYVKAKINQIYRNKDNSTSFVFPIDETGQLKAFVSCGELPRFEINADDGELYEHKFGGGFEEHFKLSDYDIDNSSTPVEDSHLSLLLTPTYERDSQGVHPCCELTILYDNVIVPHNQCIINYYYDDVLVDSYSNIEAEQGNHKFSVVVIYEGETKFVNKTLYYDGNL